MISSMYVLNLISILQTTFHIAIKWGLNENLPLFRLNKSIPNPNQNTCMYFPQFHQLNMNIAQAIIIWLMNGKVRFNSPQILSGASNSRRIGWLRNSSLDLRHRPLISFSVSWTFLPGRDPRTEKRIYTSWNFRKVQKHCSSVKDRWMKVGQNLRTTPDMSRIFTHIHNKVAAWVKADAEKHKALFFSPRVQKEHCTAERWSW